MLEYIPLIITANGESSRIRRFLDTNKMNLFVSGKRVSQYYSDSYACADNRLLVFIACSYSIWDEIRHKPAHQNVIHLPIEHTTTRTETIKQALKNVQQAANNHIPFEFKLSEGFIVSDCDVIHETTDIMRLISFFRAGGHGCAITVDCTETDAELKYGFVEINEDDSIVIDYNEKKKKLSYKATGMYSFDSRSRFIEHADNNQNSLLDYACAQQPSGSSVCYAIKVTGRVRNIGDIKSYIENAV